jgi:hypothetical protein
MMNPDSYPLILIGLVTLGFFILAIAMYWKIRVLRSELDLLSSILRK